MKTQKHQKVLKILGFKIFNGHLEPGEKLPTEHALTQEMNVDRTSLRVALKLLEFLNVLEIRQGDGIYVKDFRGNAGVDFLRMLFEIHAAELEKGEENPNLIDAYMLDEMFEFWVEFLPSILLMMSRKYSPKDIRTLQNLYDEQLNHFDDKHRMVNLDLMALDVIGEITDNMVIRLIINSSRPIRKQMIYLLYSVFPNETLKADIDIRKSLLDVAYTGTKEQIEQAINEYKTVLLSYRKQAREIWTRYFQKGPGEKD